MYNIAAKKAIRDITGLRIEPLEQHWKYWRAWGGITHSSGARRAILIEYWYVRTIVFFF